MWLKQVTYQGEAADAKPLGDGTVADPSSATVCSMASGKADLMAGIQCPTCHHWSSKSIGTTLYWHQENKEHLGCQQWQHASNCGSAQDWDAILKYPVVMWSAADGSGKKGSKPPLEKGLLFLAPTLQETTQEPHVFDPDKALDVTELRTLPTRNEIFKGAVSKSRPAHHEVPHKSTPTPPPPPTHTRPKMEQRRGYTRTVHKAPVKPDQFDDRWTEAETREFRNPKAEPSRRSSFPPRDRSRSNKRLFVGR